MLLLFYVLNTDVHFVFPFVFFYFFIYILFQNVDLYVWLADLANFI